MSCRTIHLPGRGTAIVCGPRVRRPLRRCVVCNIAETMATMKLCDYPVSDSRTCDRPVCVDHARHVEPDTDYCPAHAHDADACPYCGRLGNGEPCAPYCGAAPDQRP